MSETINFNEFKAKAKFETFKREAKDRIVRTGKWYWENKEFTIPVTVAAVTMVTKGLGKVSHQIALNREETHRNLKSWDPRLGEWLELKRALTNSEKVAMDARLKNGERKVDVLKDLGVLKQ